MKNSIIFPKEHGEFQFRVLKKSDIYMSQIKTSKKFIFLFGCEKWKTLGRWWGNYGCGELPGYNDFRVIFDPHYFSTKEKDAIDLIDDAIFQLNNKEKIHKTGYWPIQFACFNLNINVALKKSN